MSKEAMEILVKDVIRELVWDNPDWDKKLRELPKEDLIEVMKNVTEVYAEVRLLTTTLGAAIRKDEGNIDKIIDAAILLNPIN